tara:strand:+ start:346 stop:489 length:144 start_codon:yes stop_codon:yes gene_type:complete
MIEHPWSADFVDLANWTVGWAFSDFSQALEELQADHSSLDWKNSLTD